MKKLVCLALAVLLLVTTAFAASVTESVPCQYDNAVVFREGDYLQTVKDGRGVVCRLDGTAVLDTAETQYLLDGYLHVGAYEGQSVWSLDGKKLTETWDDIPEVAHDVAICGKGSWGRPATLHGVYGAVDLKTGAWIVPQEYPSLTFSQDGTCLIAQSADGAVRAFDLTGAEVRAPEDGRVPYGNGMYRLSGSSTLRYSDGAVALSGVYGSIEAVCGDVIFAKKPNDETLYCLSLTGQVLNTYANGYVAFSADDCDFVVLGKNRELEEVAVVNRWGETISPFTKGDTLLSSGGSTGKGLELLNTATGKTRWLTADGMEIPYVENGILMARLGVILKQDAQPSLLALDGSVLIPAGKYQTIGTDGAVYAVGRRTAKPDGLVVQSADGKYGLLRVDGGYEYPAHTWAQPEIDDAIAAGLIPAEQQRDWRNGCTRGDFCRFVAAAVRTISPELAGTETVTFTDTDDADILCAASLGIVNGVGEGKFAPDRPVTRQEAAVMLSRAAKALGIPASGEDKTFADRGEFATWAVDGIADTVRRGVMQGVSADRFNARGTYTREQAALTMLRLFHAAK
ncbi:MAG: S-layer homology domain-containing protein [Oscillospiraceae bacterium]|nr:S-layer homology domain-containing protein [Oscillospiraceae bacterium]